MSAPSKSLVFMESTDESEEDELDDEMEDREWGRCSGA